MWRSQGYIFFEVSVTQIYWTRFAYYVMKFNTADRISWNLATPWVLNILVKSISSSFIYQYVGWYTYNPTSDVPDDNTAPWQLSYHGIRRWLSMIIAPWEYKNDELAIINNWLDQITEAWLPIDGSVNYIIIFQAMSCRLSGVVYSHINLKIIH